MQMQLHAKVRTAWWVHGFLGAMRPVVRLFPATEDWAVAVAMRGVKVTLE